MQQNTCGRFPSEVLAVVLLALGWASGCGGTCDTSDEENGVEVYRGGATRGDSYASSSTEGPLLHFPGGKQYQLVHHLGHTPAMPAVYFAFDPHDDRVAPCAGNSCVIRCWDDQIIWVKNDTCTEFWILVTAVGESPYPVARCPGDSEDGGATPLRDAAASPDATELVDSASEVGP